MTAEVISRQRRRWLERHPRGQREVRGGVFTKRDKDNQRILWKRMVAGVEHAFHATKGLRKRRINS